MDYQFLGIIVLIVSTIAIPLILRLQLGKMFLKVELMANSMQVFTKSLEAHISKSELDSIKVIALEKELAILDFRIKALESTSKSAV